MCGNRVEELESRVQELEASVEGLTDELIESKVRIRELESAVGDDIGFESESSNNESTEIETAESSPGPETIDDSSDAAEATKTEGNNSENKTEESESDIIIA
jgi:hypothetical protein